MTAFLDRIVDEPMRANHSARITAVDGALGLVNLTGRSVDCIKTADHKDEIFHSWVEATRVLGWAVRAIDSIIVISLAIRIIDIYRDPPEVTSTEESSFGYGLAPFVGRAREDEFRARVLTSQRPLILRTSSVLGRERGA